MTDTFTITLDDDAAQARLDRMIERAQDMTGLMRKWAGHLQDVAVEAFATETAPDGTRWVDLSPVTKAMRQRRGHWPGQKLQVSGLLALSLTPQHGGEVVGPNFVEIGSNQPYARIQQKGGMAGRGGKVKIPARPFLGVSSEAHEAIEADTIAWLTLAES